MPLACRLCCHNDEIDIAARALSSGYFLDGRAGKGRAENSMIVATATGFKMRELRLLVFRIPFRCLALKLEQDCNARRINCAMS
jgi:hypothetical protein